MMAFDGKRIVEDRIVRKHILYAEGRDTQNFFIKACQSLNLDNIQAFNFEGISNLTKGVKQLLNTPRQKGITVKTITVIRDIEVGNLRGSVSDSVKFAFESAGLAIPDAEFCLTAGNLIDTAFALMPGPGQTGHTLESLCLHMLAEERGKDCVAAYLDCCEGKGESYRQRYKNEFYAYLAGTEKYKGLKVGEAAKAGAFDFNHAAFRPYRELLQQINGM